MFKLISNLIRSIANEAVDKAIERFARDQYTENMLEMVPVTKKVGPIQLMEIVMRSNNGLPPARPLGSHIRFSPWDKLLFNPVHLFRFPTPDNVPISTSVTIGKRAKKTVDRFDPHHDCGHVVRRGSQQKCEDRFGQSGVTNRNCDEYGRSRLDGRRERSRESFDRSIQSQRMVERKRKIFAFGCDRNPARTRGAGIEPQRTPAKNIGKEFQEMFGIPDGEDVVIHSRLPGVDTKEQFSALVRRLKDETDVPVGLKIAATHHLEKEMQIALEAEVDFITVDGAEGGTHAAAPTMEDDLGLPTLYAVSRASKFLAKKGASREVSLIATGGLITPGDCLKAMALGADAVYIGTVALMALVGDQLTETLPFEPPTSLVVYNAKMTDQLDVDRSAANLVNYLNAVVREMELVCYSLDKTNLTDISKSDLCALDPDLSRVTGVELGFISGEEQKEFFEGFSEYPLTDSPNKGNPNPEPQDEQPQIH